MLFLYLYNVGSKKGHKATTHNCVPQGKGVSVYLFGLYCALLVFA